MQSYKSLQTKIFYFSSLFMLLLISFGRIFIVPNPEFGTRKPVYSGTDSSEVFKKSCGSDYLQYSSDCC